MSEASPFDHQPDPELGSALRAVLSVDDDEAFTARVMAAADSVFGRDGTPSDWVAVLTSWAIPGAIAAALALVAAMALWLAAQTPANPVTLGDPLRTSDTHLAVPALLASAAAPDMDVVLAVALEN